MTVYIFIYNLLQNLFAHFTPTINWVYYAANQIWLIIFVMFSGKLMYRVTRTILLLFHFMITHASMAVNLIEHNGQWKYLV